VWVFAQDSSEAKLGIYLRLELWQKSGSLILENGRADLDPAGAEVCLHALNFTIVTALSQTTAAALAPGCDTDQSWR